MRNPTRALVSGSVCLTLAACGGGGGSGGVSPLPDTLAEITSTNAPAIASAVVKASLEGGDLGSFADLSGGLGGAVTTKASPVYSKIGEVQITQTKAMLTESQLGTFQAPIAPVESDCLVDGTITVSGDIQDPLTLSMNDVLTIQFNACDDGGGEVNGTMSMTIRSFSGDFVAGDVAFEVTVSLTDFAVTEGAVTTTANGSITLGMTLPLAGAIGMTIESQNFTVSDGTSTESLDDFLLTQTIDPITGAYTMLVSGSIGSSAFNGSVTFTTTTSLEGMGEEYAFLGEIVITGDQNATITILVLDGQFLRLEVDLDGDGDTDQVIDTSWAELV